jgi:hypothetical protein
MVAREGPQSGVQPVRDVYIQALLYLAARLSWSSVVLSLQSQSVDLSVEQSRAVLSFRGAGNLTEFVMSATERDVVLSWRLY